MASATTDGSVAEAALSIVARTEHLPLTAVLRLRATTRYLCSELTGHMPHALLYKAACRLGRIQVGPDAVFYAQARSARVPVARLDPAECSWSRSWSCDDWLAQALTD